MQKRHPTSSNRVSAVLTNGPRRHLPVGQRAVCIALNQDWSKANVRGQNNIIGRSTDDQNKTQTTADRQALSGASEKTQRLADKIARTDPELALRVAQGEMGIYDALKQMEPALDLALQRG